jgi:hypothetical protein
MKAKFLRSQLWREVVLDAAIGIPLRREGQSCHTARIPAVSAREQSVQRNETDSVCLAGCEHGWNILCLAGEIPQEIKDCVCFSFNPCGSSRSLATSWAKRGFHGSKSSQNPSGFILYSGLGTT